MHLLSHDLHRIDNGDDTMFGNFTEEARKILINAKKEMYDLNHPYVGSEHFMLALLKENNAISRKLKEYNLDYQGFRNEIIEIVGVGSKPSEWFLQTPLLKRVMENAILDSKENNRGEVTLEHLFVSLLEEGEGVAIRIMLGMNIDIESLHTEFCTKNSVIKQKKNKKLLIDELGIDLTKKARNQELDPVIGRDKEIKRVLEILLRRTKNNPILIGEAGVGKTAIVEELARLIAHNEVPVALKNKRIISLDMATMVAGTKYRGEFEERVRKVLKEIEDNDNIILFIDEIHTLVGAGGAEGAIDASNIFKPALARGKLKCIGATTIAEYKKFIEEDGALERRFQKVIVDAPTVETVREILQKLKPIYEDFHHVTLKEDILNEVISLSEKYIYNRNQPDKAIDLLDEVCASVSLKEGKSMKQYHECSEQLNEVIKMKNEAIMANDFEKAAVYKEQEKEWMDKVNHLELGLYKPKYKEVTKKDIAAVIHLKTQIPVYEILNENKQILLKAEKELCSHIFGQPRALKEVLQLMKRIKMGFTDEHRCYSILLSGPSGTGKTELSKLFGGCLVGKENVFRLDMSEFSEAHSISKFVGAPPGYVGYADHKNILEDIRNKPNCVLILDEIEKAHPNIINLLFQILDNGKIKDSQGNAVRFDNVTIFMTSNIGFHDINIGFTKMDTDIVLTKLKENFSVPFINRIDSVIVFDPLTEDTVRTIVQNKIQQLKTKYRHRNISLKIDNLVIDEVVELCNYEEFGARKIDKIIKDKVENTIIEMVLEDVEDVVIKSITQPV